MTSYASLLALIAPVFVAVFSGFALRRLGKLRAEADSSILTISLNFLYPCFIADTVLGNPALRDPGNLLFSPVVGAVLLACCFAVAAIVSRAIGLARPQPHGTFTFTAAIPNWGFLPIPIVAGLFDKGTTGVLFVHNIGFELCMWSLGVWVISGHGGWRRALNVPFFAILGALLLNLVHAADWLPDFVKESLHFIGKGAIPLQLILTGAMLADSTREGGLLRDWTHTLAGCAVKLLILPPLILLAARWLPCSIELKPFGKQ